ncbi:hypothetical protein GL279_00445 [Paracoccus limosus]|uniref:Uncharacterized protein n=1 Tax=Paracoccus limosus TaxID=913252 RepID=A0A844H3F1_9RHOB|nr:hypothetical protein [Paracoccus limosus]MTH33067.1 hypothetical protein [Paracoccus limosus]
MVTEVELAAAGKSVEIIDPNAVETEFVDWLVSCKQFEGVVSLGLGTVDYAAQKPGQENPHVVITSKLRMSIPMAARIHAVLGMMLADVGFQPEGQQARNTLN